MLARVGIVVKQMFDGISIAVQIQVVFDDSSGAHGSDYVTYANNEAFECIYLLSSNYLIDTC